jgi:hypothetical protein
MLVLSVNCLIFFSNNISMFIPLLRYQNENIASLAASSSSVPFGDSCKKIVEKELGVSVICE